MEKTQYEAILKRLNTLDDKTKADLSAKLTIAAMQHVGTDINNIPKHAKTGLHLAGAIFLRLFAEIESGELAEKAMKALSDTEDT